jgi:hypothetical protein
MRRITMLPLLLLTLLLGACDDVSGLGGRTVDGDWSARIDGEEVWVRLRDSRGEIRGSGDWGFDDVYVTGDRFDSDVYLEFDFDDFNPIEFEGIVRGRELEGRLYGSGLNGEYIRFHRE